MIIWSEKCSNLLLSVLFYFTQSNFKFIEMILTKKERDRELESSLSLEIERDRER